MCGMGLNVEAAILGVQIGDSEWPNSDNARAKCSRLILLRHL